MSLSAPPRPLVLAAALLAWAGVLPAGFASSAQSQTRAAGPRLEPALRVATVGYRLALAAAPQCPSRIMLTGLVLHDRSAYDERARAGLAPLGWGFGVRAVVANSPADEAGLREGDEIVAIEGQDLRDYRKGGVGRSGTFDRTEAFTALLASTLQERPARLGILRGGQQRDILLSQKPGCAAAFTLTPGRSPDAWTDGRYLAVTDEMERRAGDDALAFAMAHELAHVALSHTKGSERPLAALGIGAGAARKEETDADRFAVHLVHTAGYDPAGGLQLFEILRAGSPLRFGFTHPSIRARIAAVNAEIAQLGGGS